MRANKDGSNLALEALRFQAVAEDAIRLAEDNLATARKAAGKASALLRPLAYPEAALDVTTDASTAERIVRRRQVARAVEEFPALALAVLVEDDYCDEDLRQLKKLLLLLAKAADGK